MPESELQKQLRINAELRAQIECLTTENETLSNNYDKSNMRYCRQLVELKRLWCLLDDISTAGDMFKPEINGYFKYVNRKCDERDGILTSDGYELLTTNEIPVSTDIGSSDK